jgi:hypothetical protein
MICIKTVAAVAGALAIKLMVTKVLVARSRIGSKRSVWKEDKEMSKSWLGNFKTCSLI